jgi:hypothetical protein
MSMRTGLPARRGQGIAIGFGTRPWWGAKKAMESEELGRRLAALRVEHRDLDAAIAALSDLPQPDQIQLARLKKRKLRLKDEIAQIHDALLPDIIA